MTKREITKILKSTYKLLKKDDPSYDFILNANEVAYRVLIIKVTKNTQITLNSKIFWELKKGKLDGLRFKGSDPLLLNLKRFMNLENKLILFTNKPYRVLKVINESEVIDISNNTSVYDVSFTHDLSKIEKILSI